MHVIGFLNSASPEGYAQILASFRQALKETGFVHAVIAVMAAAAATGQPCFATAL
jgi:hypothetical protein